MCRVQCLSTLSLPLWVSAKKVGGFARYSNDYLLFLQTRCAQAPTASCSTQNSSSPAKKMLLTTTLVATTPSERKSSISYLTGSVSLQISALASRDSSSSTRLVEAPALALLLFSWSVFRSTMARNRNLSLPYTQLPRSPLL